MVDVSCKIMSPCCVGYQSEVILIMPDPQTDEDVCLLRCDNPDCMTSYGGVFTGMSCVPLEVVQEHLDLMMISADVFLAQVAY